MILPAPPLLYHLPMASLCLPMTSKNQQMNQILVPISPKKKILLRKNRLKSPPKIIKTIQIQMRTIRTTIQIKNWKMMIHMNMTILVKTSKKKMATVPGKRTGEKQRTTTAAIMTPVTVASLCIQLCQPSWDNRNECSLYF